MIFDTNILIHLSKYILQPEKLIDQNAAISVITKIESLGYSFPNHLEYELISNICNELKVISLSDDIAEKTIWIRKRHKIKLPDAIIYATAFVHNMPLLTNNPNGFKSLSGKVKLIDPFTL